MVLSPAQTYGDNVSAVGPDANGHKYAMGNAFTPNVAVSYNDDPPETTDVIEEWRYYNDSGEWNHVLFMNTGTGEGEDGVPVDRFYRMTFTPDAGFGVKVNSFVLDEYTGFPTGSTWDNQVKWTVYKDSVGAGQEDCKVCFFGVWYSMHCFLPDTRMSGINEELRARASLSHH